MWAVDPYVTSVDSLDPARLGFTLNALRQLFKTGSVVDKRLTDFLTKLCRLSVVRSQFLIRRPVPICSTEVVNLSPFSYELLYVTAQSRLYHHQRLLGLALPATWLYSPRG